MGKQRVSRWMWIVSMLAFWGMSSASMVQAQQLKVAVVDMNQAMNDIEAGKVAKASLEKRFAEKKATLDKKQQELQQMQEDIERKAMVMSEQTKQQKAIEFQQKLAEFQQSRQEAEQEMATLQAQLQDDLTEKLRKVVATIAQREGYTLVVEKAVAWYSLPQYDITTQLIKEYNTQTAKTK